MHIWIQLYIQKYNTLHKESLKSLKITIKNNKNKNEENFSEKEFSKNKIKKLFIKNFSEKVLGPRNFLSKIQFILLNIYMNNNMTR
jgi:hypothetical protein